MNNILDDFNKEMCCGCTACKSICPKDAVEMKCDDQGFLYPTINKDKCIDCGLCIKVCNFRKFEANFNSKIDTYAIKHKNEEEVRTSRSGAFFMALADYVLDKHGYVFGCELQDKYTIIHKFYSDKSGVNKFKGSKYVQSNLLDTFKECCDFLKQKKYVLFSGTGCQVHGLLSYLEQKQVSSDKLITCDMVCHGAPSPKLWKDYINAYEKINNEVILDANFRNKEMLGWESHKESFKMESGKEIVENKWSRLFYLHNMFRPSCYSCKYTTPYRNTDFTMADCWGIGKVVKEFDDDRGTSLVIVNTFNAKKIFNEIKNNVNYKEIDINDVLQPQLLHPVKKGEGYNRFWRTYNKNPEKCIKKYFFPSNLSLFILKVKNKIKRILRKII